MATKKKSSKRLSSLFSSSAVAEETASQSRNPPKDKVHGTTLLTPSSAATIPNKLFKPAPTPDEERPRPASYSMPSATISRKPLPHARAESLTVQPPHPVPTDYRSQTSSPATSRRPSMSSDVRSYPTTPVLQVPSLGPQGTIEVAKGRVKRRSWIHREKDSHSTATNPPAWILGHAQKLAYDVTPLINAEKIPELWDETGDIFIYLFPRISGKGPSFRMHSSILGASSNLRELAHGRNHSVPISREDLDPNNTSRTPSPGMLRVATPPQTPQLRGRKDDEASMTTSSSRLNSNSTDTDTDAITHLYLPIAFSNSSVTPGAKATSPQPDFSPSDVDQLLGVRNAFSFLIGGSLVSTERRPSIFPVFLQIAEMLSHFGFTNQDGSTFGETAESSFEGYIDELQLADVRNSREKTIEAIVLGERMRSFTLYSEGFTHSVGKYDDIRTLKHSKYELISAVTQKRLERAALDLSIRRKNIEIKLQEFEFPAIFSGIMASKTDDARKSVNFDTWRSSFISTRRFFVGYYKHKYGSWPPKASSKKNSLETSGLHRHVLRDLYHDLATVYDLLVDRKSLTTRGLDGNHEAETAQTDPFSVVLRRVLHEYDSSVPPVQPAVPYDVPMLFDLSTIKKVDGVNIAKDLKNRNKKLKEEELVALLRQSINQDSNISTPFLDAFKEFEHKSLHGKSVSEICNFRCGEWIFIYAVLQALPMLVIDAPGVRCTRGVEYFLCEAPLSSIPWAREERGLQRSWYGIAGGGVVSLPSDVIEHGVEGVYRRSHCWLMAAKWSRESGVLAAAIDETLNDPLPPPPGLLNIDTGSRPGSRSSMRSKGSSVVNLGLEVLPIPSGGSASSPTLRRASTPVDLSKTFDAILGPAVPSKQGKKKK